MGAPQVGLEPNRLFVVGERLHLVAGRAESVAAIHTDLSLGRGEPDRCVVVGKSAVGISAGKP